MTVCLVWPSGRAFPAAAADPAVELSKAARYFRDGQAHQAEFAQTFTPGGFTRGRREHGTVLVQAPENLRFDYLSPDKVFTFDGKTARFYAPAEHQMIVRPLSEEDRAQLPLIFLESPDDLARSFMLALEPGSGSTTILLTPRSSEGDIAWIRLSLSESGAPVGLSFQTSAGDRTEFQFQSFHATSPRSPAEFTIHPPAGTRIVANEP